MTMSKQGSKKLAAKINLFEKLATYGNRAAFLSALADSGFDPNEVSQWEGKKDILGRPEQTGIPPVSPATVQQEEPRNKIPYGPPSSLASVDPKNQEALNNFMMEHNLGAPIKVDSYLGPETRAAMNKVKQYLRQPKMDDQALFSQLAMPGNQMNRAKAIQNQPMSSGVSSGLARSEQYVAPETASSAVAKNR
jgi:hypothetical protein